MLGQKIETKIFGKKYWEKNFWKKILGKNLVLEKKNFEKN